MVIARASSIPLDVTIHEQEMDVEMRDVETVKPEGDQDGG